FCQIEIRVRTFVRGSSRVGAFAAYLSSRPPRHKMQRQALLRAFVHCRTSLAVEFVLHGTPICLSECDEHSLRRKFQFPRLLLRLQKLMMSYFSYFQFNDGRAQHVACGMKTANVPHFFGRKSENLFGEVRRFFLVRG